MIDPYLIPKVPLDEDPRQTRARLQLLGIDARFLVRYGLATGRWPRPLEGPDRPTRAADVLRDAGLEYT